MRKLFSIGALLAASMLGLWTPKPAVAHERVGAVVVVRYHHRHHRYYHPYYRYYRYY